MRFLLFYMERAGHLSSLIFSCEATESDRLCVVISHHQHEHCGLQGLLSFDIKVVCSERAGANQLRYKQELL